MVVCSIRGCNEKLEKYPTSEIVLCRKHLAAARELISLIETSAGLVEVLKPVIPKPSPAKPATAKPKAVKPAAKPKPKAPAKKVLKDDREVEDVVMSLLVKRGQAIARTILENYDIMRGEHPTKIARLLAVMRSVAEKNPGLVVEGTSKDTKLKKVQEVPPQPPQETQQETTTTQG